MGSAMMKWGLLYGQDGDELEKRPVKHNTYFLVLNSYILFLTLVNASKR